jgi:hypothetical protein
LAVIETLIRGDSLAMVYHAVMRVAIDIRLGDSTAARARVDSLIRRFPPERVRRQSTLIGLAAALVTIGKSDRGLDLLDRAFASPTSGWWWGQLRNPLWDPVRADPRFRQIEARIGVSPSVETR